MRRRKTCAQKRGRGRVGLVHAFTHSRFASFSPIKIHRPRRLRKIPQSHRQAPHAPRNLAQSTPSDPAGSPAPTVGRHVPASRLPGVLYPTSTPAFFPRRRPDESLVRQATSPPSQHRRLEGFVSSSVAGRLFVDRIRSVIILVAVRCISSEI
jgi:hypothetical protein